MSNTLDADKLTHEKMFALVTQLAAVKSRQDIDAAMQIYHERGTLESPSFEDCSTGSAQIRSSLELFFALCPDYNVNLEGYAFDGDTMIAWGKVRTTLTGTFDGFMANGKTAQVPVFILFNFVDEKISYESFNIDLASLCRQSGVPAEALIAPSKQEGAAA